MEFQDAMDGLFHPLDAGLRQLVERSDDNPTFSGVTLDDAVDLHALREAIDALQVQRVEIGQLHLVATITADPPEAEAPTPIAAIRCEFLALKLRGRWCVLPLSGAHGNVDVAPEPRPAQDMSPLDSLGDAISAGLLTEGTGLPAIAQEHARGVYPDAMVEARGAQMQLAADRLADLAQTVRGLSTERGLVELADLRANLYGEGASIRGQVLLRCTNDTTGALTIHAAEVSGW